MKISRKAFSLIELLIVITIIGILAVAFLPSITSGPSRARDVQRVSDLSDIALALELYYQDNGQYPTAASSSIPTVVDAYFDNGVAPLDPTLEDGYYYETCNGTQGFGLAALVENPKTTDNYYYKSGFAYGTSQTLVDTTTCALSSPTAPTSTNSGNIYVIMKQ